MNKFKGSVFITGATTGIGFALAKKYKAEGYRVGICARSSEKLSTLKNDFEVFKVDVRFKEEVENAIKSFSKEGLDIVIANAGKSYANKSRLPDFNIAREIIDINLMGVINTFEIATKIFLEQGHGHLVATSSVAGLNGLPGVSAYSASKSAVMKLCESLRLDLKQENIKVSCICPGFVDTPLTQVNPHPMPFMVTPEFAATEIFYGIAKNKGFIYFPFFFSLIVRILSILPRVLYSRIMSFKSFNYSKE